MLANVGAVGEDAGMDFELDGLLAGLYGEQRADRARLLARLQAEGFSAAELTAAVRENRLALLPIDRVLSGTYTAAEIEQRTGLPASLVVRIRQMEGLPEPGPDDRVFTDQDIEAARSTKLFLDVGFTEEHVLDVSRVLGEGMARLTATVLAAFTATFLSPGDAEEGVALRFAELTERLAPAIAPILVSQFTAHLRDTVARGMLGPAELQTGDVAGAQDLAVAFADLVGFTRLGGVVEVNELGTLAGQLARSSAALAQAPVRLVKTIGDAAMFVSPEPAPLVDVALQLIAAFDDAELPSLRVGIAWGPAMMRGGDYYGNSVNLASRVTGAARPGTVLCTKEVHDAAPDSFEWSSAGRHRLKGVSRPQPLYRARRRIA